MILRSRQLIRRVCIYGSASFTPFAARTQQYVKEQLGQTEDKVRVVICVLSMRLRGAGSRRRDDSATVLTLYRPSCPRNTSSSKSGSMR